MPNYKEIIDRNIALFNENLNLSEDLDRLVTKLHTQSLISFLEEENNRLEEELQVYSFLTKDDFIKGIIQEKKNQIAHKIEIISYLKGI